MITELQTYGLQKSFNRKAHLITEGDMILLRSYETIVAVYNTVKESMIINDFYSNTTSRHLNAFLIHCGFDTKYKKGMENEFLTKNN